MPSIKELKDIEWELNEEEDIWIGYSPDLEYTHMGFIYAKLEPRQELKPHYHKRPEDGDEIFIFYQKGHILLKTVEDGEIKEKEYIIEEDNPISIAFKNKEPHGIKNIGEEPIIFLALYAPAFVPGEVKHPTTHNL